MPRTYLFAVSRTGRPQGKVLGALTQVHCSDLLQSDAPAEGESRGADQEEPEGGDPCNRGWS